MTTKILPEDSDPADQVELQQSIKNMTFAAAIKAHRQCESWTLAVASEKLGVSLQMLSAYERGIKMPSIVKAVDIANRLGFCPQLAIKYLINDQLKQANLPYRVEKLAS